MGLQPSAPLTWHPLGLHVVPAECKSQGDTKGPSHTNSSPSQCEGQAMRATETVLRAQRLGRW